MKTTINISGFNIFIAPVEQVILNRLPVDVYVRFNILEGTFKGIQMYFLDGKDNNGALTPSQCSKIVQKISGSLDKPIVFIFDKMMFYQRKRMIEQGVNFVVSGKYANLPNLFINVLETSRKEKSTGKLSPVAQYVLLSYIQSRDKDYCTVKKLQEATPFSYMQITRAIVDIENFGLCETELKPKEGKNIRFSKDRRSLWVDALPYMRNPVKRTVYTDIADSLEDSARISGMNALAHYSSLNQVKQMSLALNSQDFKTLTASNIEVNTIEGSTAIQEWIYPPTICTESEYVDPLSLWLSLKDGKNPRVEDALEQLIENMKW